MGNKKNETQRLDKIISNQTGNSRKDTKKIISKGLVLVDGTVILDASKKFNPEEVKIIADGVKINYKKYIYIMMNKPKGVLSASEDRREKTVVDLIPYELYREGIFPAGRLDKDTTGFIFLTTDGDFSHKMLSPNSGVEKIYHANIDKKLTKEDVKKFESGILTEHGTYFKPSKIKVVDKNTCGDIVEIAIIEGKYHQIKRMIGTINGQVLELKRVKIGGLNLDENLHFGECREITPQELAMIM